MSLVFVIPIAHPQGPRISNYGHVEKALRLTLGSVAGQTASDVRTVVVGNRVPEWHSDCAGTVDFLSLGTDDRFPLPHAQRHIDKAMKLGTGALFALERHAPDFVMFIDGDDTLHLDLARRVMAGELPPGGKDGWILTHGLNAVTRIRGGKFVFSEAYEVGHFDQDCGTCRILKASALARVIPEVLPRTASRRNLLPTRAPAEIPSEITDALFEDADAAFPERDATLRLFGNHILQERIFDLAPLPLPLAAKSCGHGNHVGPRGGALHWHRVLRRLELDEFMASFGLAGSTIAETDPVRRSTIEVVIRPHVARTVETVTVTLKRIRNFCVRVLRRLRRSLRPSAAR